MRREVLPTLSKAFLVTFAVIGKSNCLPRHERQTAHFLHLCYGKSSYVYLYFSFRRMPSGRAQRGIAVDYSKLDRSNGVF
jgi:hypothetical protein